MTCVDMFGRACTFLRQQSVQWSNHKVQQANHTRQWPNHVMQKLSQMMQQSTCMVLFTESADMQTRSIQVTCLPSGGVFVHT